MGVLAKLGLRKFLRLSVEEMAQRRIEQTARVEEYLASHSVKGLDLSGGIDVVPASGGRGSLVFFVHVSQGPSVVFRAVHKPKRLKRRCAGHALLGNLGLSVPLVLYRDLSRKTLREYGWVVMVEELASGEPFAQASDLNAAAANAGRTFAELHNNLHDQCEMQTSSTEIRYWIDRRYSPERMRRKASDWLNRYENQGMPEVGLIADWIARQPSSSWEQGFRLSVGDASVGNMIASEDGVSLIDLGDVHFGSAVQDVAGFLTSVLEQGNYQSLVSPFLSAYQGSASIDLLNELKRSLGLFFVLQSMRNLGKPKPPIIRELYLEEVHKVMCGDSVLCTGRIFAS